MMNIGFISLLKDDLQREVTLKLCSESWFKFRASFQSLFCLTKPKRIKMMIKYQQEKQQIILNSCIWNQRLDYFTFFYNSWGFIFWSLNNWLILPPLFFSTGRTFSHFLSPSVTRTEIATEWNKYPSITRDCSKSFWRNAGNHTVKWEQTVDVSVKWRHQKVIYMTPSTTQHLESVTLVRYLSDRGWIYPFTYNFSCQSISMKILHWVDFELGHLLLAAVCRIFAGRECVKRWTWWGRSIPTLFRAWGELRWLTAGVSWRNKAAQ